MARTFELRQVGGREPDRLLGLIRLQDDRRPDWFLRSFSRGEVRVEEIADDLPEDRPVTVGGEDVAAPGRRRRRQ